MQKIIEFPKHKIYVIDLFCGAGGTSTAINESNTQIEVIACINHDKNAILSHQANHPNCLHYIEDIRTIDLSPLKKIIDDLRRKEPGCKIAIWASLECTNFSRAKCGPKDPDSRTLAEDLFRYLDVFNPDFLWIENVQEFLTWGPLDEDNKPIKELQGASFEVWRNEIQTKYNYKGFWKDILCSADFGGYTIRKRLFIQFSKNEYEIGIPKPTTPDDWNPVKDVLDLNTLGVSMFNRKKDYVWKTHRRIFKGLEKFGHENRFGYKYYGQGGYVKIHNPCCTLTTKDRVSLVTPVFIKQDFGKLTNRPLCKPMASIIIVPKADIVHFVHNPQYGGSNRSINKPACTVIARQDKAPLGLTSATSGSFTLKDKASDDEWMLKIKAYCRENNIHDILVRPLNVNEMLRIQGFPEGYVLVGNKGEKKKYIGNSVEVNVGIALFKSIAEVV